MSLSNLPIKGTADWLPDEFRVRKYIFDTWRSVCTRFGYEEYLTPLLEPAEVYRAKSGEDVGGVELTTLTDRAGRELAIRPEMTPSVTRMVSRIYTSSPKPLRLFSIANFFRNENSQRGRNREFWQLNFDLFGSESVSADSEVLQIALEIMLAFSPPENSFVLNLNDRRLIDSIIPSSVDRKAVVRLIDKYEKLPPEVLSEKLSQLNCSTGEIETMFKFLSSTTAEELINQLPELANNAGYLACISLMERLSDLGYAQWIRFAPNIIRGFDYYDGMVFEVFDNNPQNSRAMFGGGRYNGLAALFGGQSFPAVGCAPGDETTKLFLESWGLIPQTTPAKTYLPLLDTSLLATQTALATRLRRDGESVITSLEVQTLTKALEYANKNNFSQLIILGTQESSSSTFVRKNLETGTQTTEKF